jgi:hypothetical protein
MGTSVLMIEKHYSHLTPRMLAEQFAGVDWDAVDAKKKAAKWKDDAEVTDDKTNASG